MGSFVQAKIAFHITGNGFLELTIGVLEFLEHI
jgi:hypothetical protein